MISRWSKGRGLLPIERSGRGAVGAPTGASRPEPGRPGSPEWGMGMSAYQRKRPLRYPDVTSPDFMTRRAWWLIGANFLIPGAGSVLAGNRRFGRFMLAFWLWNLLLVIAVVVMWFVARGALFFVLSTAAGLTALVSYLLVVAVLWGLANLDTLRLTRLIRVDAFARGLVAMVSIVLLAVPFVGVAYANVAADQGKRTIQTLFGGPNAGIKTPTDGRINIMLLGADTGPDRDGTRPDSISVMSFDVASGRLTTIGVPRNLERFPFHDGPMKELYPDSYHDCDVSACYLNSVYTEVDLKHHDIYADAEKHGSNRAIEAMKNAVQGITGLPIHYYAMVDMQGFANLVDVLGGVDIDVKERVGLGINDDGSKDWEPPSVWIEPGMQHMNGEIALWYARSRYQSTDFARMARQKQLQEALLAKLTPSQVMGRLDPVVDAIHKIVHTDIPEGEAGFIADLALKSRGGNAVRVDLVPPTFDIEHPDIPAMQRAVKDALTASPTLAPTP